MRVWRSMITTLLSLSIYDRSLFVSGNTFFSKKVSTPFELSNLWAFWTLLITVWHKLRWNQCIILQDLTYWSDQLEHIWFDSVKHNMVCFTHGFSEAFHLSYGRFHWCIIWTCNLMFEKPSCYREVVKIHWCCYRLMFHPNCSRISLKSTDWESHELCLPLHQTPFQVGFNISFRSFWTTSLKFDVLKASLTASSNLWAGQIIKI